jgi:L-alanine-DL-glutamate epimerase-like enolase superfamily enzyme
VFTVPTDQPESDGTLEWTSTTLVLVEVRADGVTGMGFSYADEVAGRLIVQRLAPLVIGTAPGDHAATWGSMVAAVRNAGRPGIAATAISAVDTALWDLRARLVGVPLVSLLGRAHKTVQAYGSGGFTSYTSRQLRDQMAGWAGAGFTAMKMKVGRDQAADPHRVNDAREAIGRDARLMVDGNGAYARREALRAAQVFADRDVTWFEEPVSSDDREGLRFVRERCPAGMEIAAGEYGWGPDAFRELLAAGTVDVLQADATRCGGVTGFMLAASLAEAAHVPLSAHCAPAIHVPLVTAARPAVNLEWFHDHVRIERLLFDGAPQATDGAVAPDPSRPGFGLELKERDAERFLVWRSP